MSLTILGNPPRRVTISGALALIAAQPFLFVPSLGDPYEAPRALLVALAVAVLALALPAEAAGGRRVRTTALVLAGLALWYAGAAVLGHVASSVWGVMGRFQGLVSFALLVTVALVGARLRGRTALAFAAWLAMALAAMSIVVLVQALGGVAPQGFFGNPTIAGAWLAVATGAVVAAAAAVPRGRARMLLVTAAALGAVASGATASQAAALAVLVAGATVLAVVKRASWRIVLAVALAAVTLVGVGVGIGGSVVIGGSEPGILLGGSARSRLEIWRGTLGMIADHPVVGVGPGRYLYEFPAHQSAEHVALEGPDVRPDQAHSAVLHLAAEAGVPAALLWVALCAAALASGWRAARRGSGAALVALGGLVAYLAHATFGVSAVETDTLGWLLGGIALASAATPREARLVSRGLTVGLACVVAVLVGLYIVGNAAFQAGVARFGASDMSGSRTPLGRAVDIDPMTDIYRVALADSATYLDAAARLDALAILDRGLDLEPRSYDLALARARMLARLDRPVDEVAEAYADALSCFPLGVTVGREAVVAFESAGRAAEARAERAVLEGLGYGMQDSQ